MKVLLSSCRNPDFMTITEYMERAFRSSGCQLHFFDNRAFLLPGRLRSRVPCLNAFDLKRMNKKLMSAAASCKPDLYLELGGDRILPETVEHIRNRGTKTALWTIDAPLNFDLILKAAPSYDYVFTGGSEAYDLLKDKGIKDLSWLPFACDPDIHKPQTLTEDEMKRYGADVSFVGTLDPHLYYYRNKVLEAVSDFDLALWGPGGDALPAGSPLSPLIRGDKTSPAIWSKIYSASKVVLCVHYKDEQGEIPCHQASPRVYEALACGAFLIVNAQKDVMALFKEGEDLVVFRDLTELRDLISYYLNNPEERHRIAECGMRTVRNKHTYIHRMTHILKVLCQ